MLEEMKKKHVLFLAAGKPQRLMFDLSKRHGDVAASVEHFHLCFKEEAGHRGHPLSLESTYLYAGGEERGA